MYQTSPTAPKAPRGGLLEGSNKPIRWDRVALSGAVLYLAYRLIRKL